MKALSRILCDILRKLLSKIYIYIYLSFNPEPGIKQVSVNAPVPLALLHEPGETIFSDKTLSLKKETSFRTLSNVKKYIKHSSN